MNLFISNSNIKYFFIFGGTFFSLLLLHSLLMARLQHFPITYQNQSQENQIKLESFSQRQENCQWIVMGSSLTALLEESFFPQDSHVCNMAMGGHSAFEGLSMLNGASVFKSHLIVEMNVVKDLDQQFVHDFKNSLAYKAGATLPQLLNQNQPITLLMKYLRGKYPPAEKNVTPEQFQTFFQVHQTESSSFSSAEEDHLRELLKKMREQLQSMQKQHTDSQDLQIYLLWMPMHPGLENTVAFQKRKQLAQEVFPEQEWNWLQFPEGSWETTDGMHLTPQSAKVFASQLLKAAL